MAAFTTPRISGSRLVACGAGILLSLLPCGPLAAAGEAGEARVVTLRDGSRFLATLSPISLELAESAAVGTEIVHTPLRLEALERVEFSLAPGQERIAEILRAMAGLEAESFAERENATGWLIGNTDGFRPLLNQRLTGPETPPESRWRLRSVLRRLPDEVPSANQRPFDRIYSADGGTRDGDLGNWQVSATFCGATLPLARQSVSSISQTGTAAGNPAAETTRHLASPDDPAFGEEARSLGFETDSEGTGLKVGDDIGTRFVGDGVTFSTSSAESFVSVNVYEVSGPSRGFSIATHDPLYEGRVTIRFCMPGNPGVPAGVQAVGLWLAVVKLNGTTLQALDASGEVITELNTSGPPSEFLGLWSEVPIHALRLIPHPDIDPNYTIDDLIFTPQRPVDGLGVKEHPTLSFRNGDRVVCREFKIEGGEIAFRPLSYEAVEVRRPLSEIRTLFGPIRNDPSPFDPASYWIELTDGSRLLAAADKNHALSRLPGVDAKSLPLAALWGPARMPSPPPAASEWTPERGPMVVDEREAHQFPTAHLGAHWIEPVSEAFPEGIASTYAESPTIWFARPDRSASGVGQVRFANGERIVLGGSAGFRLKAFTTTEILIEREGYNWTIPFSDASALQLPEP
jgi:hypothetical protein